MSSQPKRPIGKLYLIGAGPGDPELLTLRGAKALSESDVILYDRLVDERTLSHAKAGAEIIYVGKHHGEQERTQGEIFELIRQHALAGQVVSRLKGGDPLIFGRGAEEWSLAHEHGIEVEIIPGVSSALAVPALAGIPLTFRRLSQSLVIVTGHAHGTEQPDWEALARADTLVILMGVKNRVEIASRLLRAGRSPREPAAFVERGSTPTERVVITTLGEVAAGVVEVSNPAVFVVGEVVAVRARLGF
jgi:uroporphyrin-III C-methyltransferase